MTIIKIKDKYNSNKVWIIKYTKCRHYYLNQAICDRLIYNKFIRTSLKHLLDIGLINLNDPF